MRTTLLVSCAVQCSTFATEHSKAAFTFQRVRQSPKQPRRPNLLLWIFCLNVENHSTLLEFCVAQETFA